VRIVKINYLKQFPERHGAEYIQGNGGKDIIVKSQNRKWDRVKTGKYSVGIGKGKIIKISCIFI
jgi:hypothetical protein